MNTFQFEFQAKVGETQTSDIAIDNIYLWKHVCIIISEPNQTTVKVPNYEIGYFT